MRTKFLSFQQLAEEYCGGKETAAIELALMGRVIVFARIASVPVVSIPTTEAARVYDHERLKDYPHIVLTGFFPVPHTVGAKALCSGRAVTRAVWHRLHDKCVPGECKVRSWFAVPQDEEHDRRALFVGEPIVLNRDDIWFGRRSIERAMEQYEVPVPRPRPEQEDRDLSTRTRNNLLRVIVGLAKEARIDLTDVGTAAKQLEGAARAAGYKGPDVQTIRPWLRDLPQPDN